MIITPVTTKNFLLFKTDWTQLPDVDLTQEEKDAWKVFRQELRDLDVNRIYIETWPVPPGIIHCGVQPMEVVREDTNIFIYLAV